MGAISRQLSTTKEELALTRAELEEAKRTLAALMSRADRDERPTLFVEGATDVPIFEAAWRVCFPDEPMPFEVLSAGGTMQMRSLAAPGEALRSVLGDRLVMALADNAGEGRALWQEGNLHKGGVWKGQTNGVWWCLLSPSDEFRSTMERFEVHRQFWPFTIENAFPADLRRQAVVESAYALGNLPRADLFRDQGLVDRIVEALAEMPDDDPAALYLKRPTPPAKDAFAAWVTSEKRLSRENYAAFEIVLSRLKDLIARHQAEHADADPPRQARLV